MKYPEYSVPEVEKIIENHYMEKKLLEIQIRKLKAENYNLMCENIQLKQKVRLLGGEK